MDADEFILILCALAEQEYGVPLHDKLGMDRDSCRQWLRALYAKRLTLRDAQQTIATVLARKEDPENLDELLYYI